MPRSRFIPCPECKKRFRNESGLRWHLYHTHEWKDMMRLLGEPSPSTLAEIAVWEDLKLRAFAKGAGMDVQYLKQLVEEHFGRQTE